MPSRIWNAEPVQSGLDAFLSGAGEAYTGVKNERRKRQVERQQDEAHRVNMEAVLQEQDRKNAEGGFSVQQGTRPDPVTQAREQVSGVRARIGAILGRITGATAEPTPGYARVAKTGPSQAEVLLDKREAGDTGRTRMQVDAGRETALIREGGDMARHNSSLEEQRRYHNLMAEDQAKDRALRERQFNRGEAGVESRSLRDYTTALTRDITTLQKELMDRGRIARHTMSGGGGMDAYNAETLALQDQIGQLRGQLGEAHSAGRKRAIGQQLGKPPTPVRTRPPTLEEDLRAAQRP